MPPCLLGTLRLPYHTPGTLLVLPGTWYHCLGFPPAFGDMALVRCECHMGMHSCVEIFGYYVSVCRLLYWWYGSHTSSGLENHLPSDAPARFLVMDTFSTHFLTCLTSLPEMHPLCSRQNIKRNSLSKLPTMLAASSS